MADQVSSGEDVESLSTEASYGVFDAKSEAALETLVSQKELISQLLKGKKT